MNAEEIKSMLNAECGKEQARKEQENIEFIRNCDIAICINVSEDFDRYSLADRIEDLLDDIPAVDDMIMYIK